MNHLQHHFGKDSFGFDHEQPGGVATPEELVSFPAPDSREEPFHEGYFLKCPEPVAPAEAQTVSLDRNPYTFPGSDSKADIFHMRARCYDPAPGRWLSVDPLG